ncbi:MAG TPA: glycosyltransferase, partial [Candidatus Nanoarchaeia archaeon]|nr:glycosyltransferase [Candidatus Nanoarchaeia archaeon]
MNIAILTPTFSQFSGPDRVVLNEALELADKGESVTIFTFKTDFQLQNKGVKVEVLGMPKSGLMERVYRLLFFADVAKVNKIVHALRDYDEVVSFLYPMTIPARIARKRYGSRLKYVYYDVGIAYPKLFEKLSERIYMRIFAAFTKMTIKNA